MQINCLNIYCKLNMAYTVVYVKQCNNLYNETKRFIHNNHPSIKHLTTQ